MPCVTIIHFVGVEPEAEIGAKLGKNMPPRSHGSINLAK
jgi:hypothetical protein